MMSARATGTTGWRLREAPGRRGRRTAEYVFPLAGDVRVTQPAMTVWDFLNMTL
jgi:hypothetical protein